MVGYGSNEEYSEERDGALEKLENGGEFEKEGGRKQEAEGQKEKGNIVVGLYHVEVSISLTMKRSPNYIVSSFH